MSGRRKVPTLRAMSFLEPDRVADVEAHAQSVKAWTKPDRVFRVRSASVDEDDAEVGEERGASGDLAVAASVALRRANKAVRQLEARRGRLIASGADDRMVSEIDRRLVEARARVRRRSAERQRLVALGDAVGGKRQRDRLAQMVRYHPQITAWHLQVADDFRDVVGGLRPGDRQVSAGELAAKRSEVFENCRACPARDACFGEGACRGRLGAFASGGVLDLWRTGRRTRDRTGRRIDAPRTFEPKPVKPVRVYSDGGMAERVWAEGRRIEAAMAFVDAAAEAALATWPRDEGGAAASDMAAIAGLEVVVLGRTIAEATAHWVMREKLRRSLVVAAIVGGLSGCSVVVRMGRMT
jgi:hypothetical protein